MTTSLQPGDVRTFQPTRGSITVAGLTLWTEPQGPWVLIHMSEEGCPLSTVTNNPESDRYNRALFRDLRRSLLQQDLWPYGEQGAETEERVSRFHPITIKGGPLSDTIIEARGRDL